MRKKDKKQIVFIHGGVAFSKHDAFLNYLRTVPIEDPFELSSVEVKKWKYTLRDELGDQYDVLYPKMPNSNNAQYEEWKVWFERYLDFVSDGVVLVGHSLGGVFLARYLSEERLPVSVRALYLVAAPCYLEEFGTDETAEDGGDFFPDESRMSRIGSVAKTVHVFHSEDDPVVSYAHGKRYVAQIPGAQLTTFSDRGHFLNETFPELVQSIRAL